MATYAIVGIVIVISIWFFSMYSILSNPFKNEKEKTFWLIAVVLIPLMSLFYIFIKKDLIKQK